MITVKIDKGLLDKLKELKIDISQLAKEVIPLWKIKIDKETGKTTRKNLRRRTGNLARSFVVAKQSYTRQGSDKFLITYDLAVPYGYIQDVGTVGKGGELPDITPKNVKWLTIPNKHNREVMTPAGVLKKFAREFEGLNFIKESETKAFLMKGESLYFTLVKKVAIKPSRWFSQAVDNARKDFDNILFSKIKDIYKL